MKSKFIIVFTLSLLFFLDTSTPIFGSGQNNDKLANASQSASNANYFLVKSVSGSGGVNWASSPNYHHMATAGQGLVEFVHGPNHIVIPGFWAPLAFTPTAVETENKAIQPTHFQLHQNHPNPFNPQTAIEYDLPSKCMVMVEVFNSVGQRIRVVSSQIQGPGQASVVWDGFDDLGKQMGSGVYLYRVTAYPVDGKNKETALFQQTKKMLLVK